MGQRVNPRPDRRGGRPAGRLYRGGTPSCPPAGTTGHHRRPDPRHRLPWRSHLRNRPDRHVPPGYLLPAERPRVFPLRAGLAFLPFVAGVIAAANYVSNRGLDRFGPKKVVPVGMILSAGAAGLLTGIGTH